MADYGIGKVVQVIGPVLDVEFAAEDLPDIYNALSIKTTNEAGQEIELIAAAAHRTRTGPRGIDVVYGRSDAWYGSRRYR